MAPEKKKVPTVGLWKKINAIQTQAPAAVKDTVSGVGNKKTASIESVLDVYLPLCAKHGVSIIPVKFEMLHFEFRDTQTKYGVKTYLHMIGLCHYMAVDADTGEEHHFNIPAHGLDDQDKSPGKILTYSLKYAYAQLFSSRKGDDPDQDNGQHEQQGRQQQKPQQQEKKQSPPTQQQAPKQEQKPDENKQPEEKKEPAPPVESKQDANPKSKEFDAAKESIKQRFPIKVAFESGKVPSWTKEVKPFVDTMASAMKGEELKKHVTDFGLFWWLCNEASGNQDLEKALKNYAAQKKKLTKGNIEFLDQIFDRRKKAMSDSSEERQPGEDG